MLSTLPWKHIYVVAFWTVGMECVSQSPSYLNANFTFMQCTVFTHNALGDHYIWYEGNATTETKLHKFSSKVWFIFFDMSIVMHNQSIQILNLSIRRRWVIKQPDTQVNFTSSGKATGTNWKKGWVGPRAILGKRTKAIQPAACYFCDCVIMTSIHANDSMKFNTPPGAYTVSWLILSWICRSLCSTHRGSNNPILMCSWTLVAGIFSPVSGEISNSSGAGGRVAFTAKTKKKTVNVTITSCLFEISLNTSVAIPHEHSFIIILLK